MRLTSVNQGSLKTRIDLLYSSSPLAYIKLIKNKKFLCFSKRAIFGEKLYQGNYFVVTWQSIRSLQWSLPYLSYVYYLAVGEKSKNATSLFDPSSRNSAKNSFLLGHGWLHVDVRREGGHGPVGRMIVNIAQILEGIILRRRETGLVAFYHQSGILHKIFLI